MYVCMYEQAKKIDPNEKQSILLASIEYFNKTCLTGQGDAVKYRYCMCTCNICVVYNNK